MTVSGRGERVLGLDVGGRRTGVAVSDELGMISSPVGFVVRRAGDLDEFRTLANRYGASRLVAGLPSGLSGREGPQATDVRTYAESIAAHCNLPLEFWDERLTTAMAERALIEGGSSRSDRKERVDAVAAAIMLQSWLDAAAHRKRRGQG